MNVGQLAIDDLEVRFPIDKISFGLVQPGGSTEYRDVAHGVWPYGAFQFVSGGTTIHQPVIDWNDRPLDGAAFTYAIQLLKRDDGLLYIRLWKVTRDQ